MNKRHFMFLFPAVFLLLTVVSCTQQVIPSYTEPDPVEEPLQPPINITTLQEFQSFIQGCWVDVDDDSFYFRITPDRYIPSEGFRPVSRGDIASYQYSDYKNSKYFPLTEDTPINSAEIFKKKSDDYLMVCDTLNNPLANFFVTYGDYCFKPYKNGYCYYIFARCNNGSSFHLGWFYKVSDDWNYIPPSSGNTGSGGSGTGTGGGSSGSLTDYIGSYSFTTASGSQTNGSITIADGTWSFESSKAGSSFTAETAESDGSSITLYYSMPYAGTLSETFTITINGSDATWNCIESNGYTAATSIIFSGLFGVIDTQISFSYEE